MVKEKKKRKPIIEMVLWLKSNNWLSLEYLFRLIFCTLGEALWFGILSLSSYKTRHTKETIQDLKFFFKCTNL